MADGLVAYDDLVRLTGLSEPHLVRKWLADNGIREFPVPGKRGRPCTTLKAMNAVLGLEVTGADMDSIRRTVEV